MDKEKKGCKKIFPRAVMVLGQSLNSDGSAPETLVSRVKMGVSILRKALEEKGMKSTKYETPKGSVLLSAEPMLICTGGDTSRTGRPEATVMIAMIRADFDRSIDERDADKKRIRFDELIKWEAETESLNTVGNFVRCVPILKRYEVKHLTLVTSDFHMPRSVCLIERVLNAYGLDIKVDAKPAPTPAPKRDDEGINALSLVDRIRHEKRMVQNHLNGMLERFNPLPSKPLGVVSDRRISIAVRELDAIRESART